MGEEREGEEWIDGGGEEVRDGEDLFVYYLLLPPQVPRQ